MKIHTSLSDVDFRKDLLNAVEQDLLNKFPNLPADWLANDIRLRPSTMMVIDIFMHEIECGHVFCDDLFGTTTKKYVASDIPFNCGLDIPRILCYDFCLLYISFFYPFINEVYRIQQTADFVTHAEFKSVVDSYNVLHDAIKKNNDTILYKMARSGKMNYLNIPIKDNKYGTYESTRTSY